MERMATADLQTPPRPVPRRRVPNDRELCITVPATAATLAGFRAWSASDEFPETGRITYLAGEIIVDMSPERLDSHGQVKIAIASALFTLARRQNIGKVYPDGGRLVNEAADVSNEPD